MDQSRSVTWLLWLSSLLRSWPVATAWTPRRFPSSLGRAVLEQEEEEKWVLKEEARRRQEERLGAQVAEEWVEVVDERTGRTYFWNTSTSASSWTRPSASPSSLPEREEEEEEKEDEDEVDKLIFLPVDAPVPLLWKSPLV